MDNKRIVIIDTDFMNYMVRGKNEQNECFQKIITDLNIQPVIHEFLYHTEMMGIPLVEKLVQSGEIILMKYEVFLPLKMQLYYVQLFEDLYRYCNGRELDLHNASIIDYRETNANLGEIHSVIMAMFTGYDLFLSNDNGARKMIEAKINTDAYAIKVMNVMDVFEEIALMNKKSMTKKEFVSFTKGDKGRDKRIKEINSMWKGPQ